jgi:hypothetical protein
MRSLSITRHVSIKSKSVEHDFSHEGDLSKMAFNLSGRIEVVLKSGRRIESFCKLPPGFANDNGREKIVRNKFYREAVTVWGDDKAGIIENLIMNIDALNISNLMDNIRK